jgi:hypothetical protein
MSDSLAFRHVFSDVINGLAPLRLWHTLWSFLTEPHLLAARANIGKLKSDSRPVAFYAACVTVGIAALSMFPHEQPSVFWDEAFRQLPTKESHEFERFFNLRPEDITQSQFEAFLRINLPIGPLQRVGLVVGSTKASSVGEYLKSSGQPQLAKSFDAASSRVADGRSLENKIGPLILPFIVLGTSFLPYLTLKKCSVGKTALVALIYFQGFWCVIVTSYIALMMHWLPGLKFVPGFSIFVLLGVIQIVHFVVVLFLATSASIERILTACIVWLGSTVVAYSGLMVAFSIIHSLLW